MKKTLYIYLLLLPIIDLITSLCTRYFDLSITFGSVIKMLFLFIFVFYAIFISKSKYRKATLIFYFLSLFYIFGYLVLKPDIMNLNAIGELTYLFKFLFFPLVFFSLLCFFDDNSFDKDVMIKILIANAFTYGLLLFSPLITGTGFNTYTNGLYGVVGWFYSANEVSVILLLLFPFLYTLIKNKRKYLFLLILPIIFLINYVGTKVTLFGLLIIGFLCLMFSFIYNKKIFKNPFVSCFLIFLIIFAISINSFTIKNIFNLLDRPTANEISDEIPCNDCESKAGDSLFVKVRKYGSRLLSNRTYYYKNINEIYQENNDAGIVLFGLGYTNTQKINNYNITKSTEMDIFDIWFHFGVIGLLIFCFPFILLLALLIKNHKKVTIDFHFYILIILMSFGISLFSGHVFMAPAVSMYIIIYFMLAINELGIFKKEINNNKIAILALHLGYGGVENVIVSQANILSEKYDVEIICLYKKKEAIPFKINDNINVKYLMNTSSNRQEFKEAFKNKKIYNLIKEGLKGFYIIITKNMYMIRYIINSKARIIISSRYSFTKLLNYYGKDKIIKIGEEHTYNINENYLKKYNKLKNIDYLTVGINKLYVLYKKEITNIEVLLMPNTINYYPNKNELSKLNNKNLISIGRLEPEKGFIDLIDIFKLIYEKDPSFRLNVFGDGSQKEIIEGKIKENHLEEVIKLWGFKDHKFIQKYLIDSSMYLLPSLEESFGLVMLEAMSYGVPCIAFDSAEGANELIKNNCGYIVKGRNKEEMANKIINYINIKDKTIFSVSTRNNAKKYTEQEVKKIWFKLLKKAINEKKYHL